MPVSITEWRGRNILTVVFLLLAMSLARVVMTVSAGLREGDEVLGFVLVESQELWVGGGPERLTAWSLFCRGPSIRRG